MFRILSIALLMGLLMSACQAQVPFRPLQADEVYAHYDRYREKAIVDRRFKHGEMLPLVQKLSKSPSFELQERGKSIQGRPIYLARYGEGPVKVLLWSQMHGDESTATMALLDLFNFLNASDEYDDLRALFREKLSLYFIPMLNPDGAEEFKRRNAIDIDINRDALRLQTPEGRLLKKIRDEVDADWGFNLHDQSRYNAAGPDPNEATFSFLAPAYDREKNVNEVRRNAMQLIVVMNNWLQERMPGKVGKFDDTFEPRAFGDNMQRWGTSTILIECGGLEGDPEKQQIRKLHFHMLLAAFEAIATEAYQGESTQAYEDLHVNDRRLFDLLIREARLEEKGAAYTVDLGFMRNENHYLSSRRFYYNATIADIGDLSTHHAYEEISAAGYVIEPGKTYPQVVANLASLKKMDFGELHRQGYTHIRLQSVPKRWEVDRLPFRVIAADAKSPANTVRLGENPAFFLIKDGKREFLVVNGFLYKLE
jgi:hypothetical protein